jgi:hypothetical protein
LNAPTFDQPKLNVPKPTAPPNVQQITDNARILADKLAKRH